MLTNEPVPDEPLAGMAPPRILLAEDDDELRSLLARTLRREGYSVFEVSDGAELLELLGRDLLDDGTLSSADIIVSDIRMPGYSGINVLHGLRNCRCKVPIVLITAFPDEQCREAVRRTRAAALLDKPVAADELRRAVQSVLAEALTR